MYSFDFKVLLGFCRYFLPFIFQKKKTGKVVCRLKWCVIIRLTVCSLTSKEDILKKKIKGMNRATRHGSVDGRLQCIFL